MLEFKISMNTKSSNISFTSNIRFIPNYAYNYLLKAPDTIIIKEICSLTGVKKINKNCATGDIYYCTAGIVKDLAQKEDYIFHWNPKSLFQDCNIKNLIPLKNKLHEIRDNELKGLLIGGNFGQDSTYKRLSKKLLTFLTKPFKKSPNCDFTIFYGQQYKGDQKYLLMSYSNLFYQKESDTYFINCVNFNRDLGKWKDLLDLQSIKDCFKYIKISPNDKVYIYDEFIPTELLNKTK